MHLTGSCGSSCLLQVRQALMTVILHEIVRPCFSDNILVNSTSWVEQAGPCLPAHRLVNQESGPPYFSVETFGSGRSKFAADPAGLAAKPVEHANFQKTLQFYHNQLAVQGGSWLCFYIVKMKFRNCDHFAENRPRRV